MKKFREYPMTRAHQKQIAQCARDAWRAGLTVEACPYRRDSNKWDIWMHAYIALPRVRVVREFSCPYKA